MERPIEKLRQLQEDNNEMEKLNDEKQALINLLSKLSMQELQLAYLYAVNMTKYGVDVTKTWETAIQNTHDLAHAYNKGYYEGLKQAAEWESERNGR